MDYEITLRRGALNVLTNILSEKLWYDGKAATAYIAGDVLVNILPDISKDGPPEPKVEGGKRLPPESGLIKEWLGKEFTFMLNEKRRDIVKKCIAYNLEKSQLSINRFTFELMEVFGFSPEEKS